MKYAVLIMMCCWFSVGGAQQLRLGKQPLALQKSAILELESDNQGLLFPRLSDTVLINSLNPPHGMVIYYTPLQKLLVRSNNRWKPLAGSLRDAEDVHLNAPSSGQLLRYNGSIWENFTPAYLTTVDTSHIAAFSVKVRSLISGGTGLTYNTSTGTLTSQAPVYYSGGIGGSAAVQTITKVWVAEVANTGTGVQTVNIPANVGFNNIICVTATAKGGTDVTNSPLVAIASTATTAIGIRVMESKNTGVLIGGNIEGLEAHTNTATRIYIRVEGN